MNAIVGGRGATLGVDLKTEAEVELHRNSRSWKVVVNGTPRNLQLPKATARASLRQAGERHEHFGGIIRTETNIPIGKGLKSSSSSSVAIALATLAAVGKRSFNRDDVLRCSAEASLASGVSLTGAFDDAASCLLGGINHTDNLARRLMKHEPAPKGLRAVISVPRNSSRRKLLDKDSIWRFSQVATRIFEISLQGDVWNAMTLNGFLYSALLGYERKETLKALELGALGAGLSGTGPAIAAVFKSGQSESISGLKSSWKKAGAVIEVRLNNKEAEMTSLD